MQACQLFIGSNRLLDVVKTDQWFVTSTRHVPGEFENFRTAVLHQPSQENRHPCVCQLVLAKFVLLDA